MKKTLQQSDLKFGKQMYNWACDLFPINRSISGPGLRETLKYIQRLLPDLKVHSVSSGSQVFDWTVPDEWTIRDAFITDESGERIVDFKAHNLHIVGYSEPVDEWMELEELDKHLYSLPDQPTAIPYITSYYSRRWGFCLTHEQRQLLKPGQYHAVIDSDLKPGVLDYGELILPGDLEKEVFLSTYICHPSMANNELSGPVVTAALAQWLKTIPALKHTYRIVFVPEKIGALVYLDKNLDAMKAKTIAGYQITCVGDEQNFSFKPSRLGNTISDRVALHVLKHMASTFRTYNFWDGGSDERQYCFPGVDLPIASVMRSIYGEYPEYHTSLDNLDFISEAGLQGSLDVYKKVLTVIENNFIPETTMLCEPKMDKRGLYPTLCQNQGGYQWGVQETLNIMAYSDGKHDLLEIAEMMGLEFEKILPLASTLLNEGLIKETDRMR